MQESNSNYVDKIMNLEKSGKVLLEQIEMLKKRTKKLAMQKGKFDSAIQSCKKCSKEFNQKENYNWSCRTHQSAFGGEMWWCCGKKGKDQPGCKFGKHVIGEDEDEDQVRLEEEDLAKKLVRCFCCKEIGHSIEKCTRDPNFKTNSEITEELIRLN